MKEPDVDMEAEWAFQKLRRDIRSDILGKIYWFLRDGDTTMRGAFMTGYYTGKAVEAGEDIKKAFEDL